MTSDFDDIIQDFFAQTTADILPSLPNSVRALREALVERALLVCDGSRVRAAYLLRMKPGTLREKVSQREKVKRLNKHDVMGVLARADLSRTQQAAILGVTPRALRYWVRRLREVGQL